MAYSRAGPAAALVGSWEPGEGVQAAPHEESALPGAARHVGSELRGQQGPAQQRVCMCAGRGKPCGCQSPGVVGKHPQGRRAQQVQLQLEGPPGGAELGGCSSQEAEQ